MPSVAAPRSFTLVSYRPARRLATFSLLRLATAVAVFLLMLVGIGDFWSVYPKAPVLVPMAPAASPTPVEVTPAPVAEPAEPRVPLTPLPGKSGPLGASGILPVPVTPAPAPVDPVPSGAEVATPVPGPAIVAPGETDAAGPEAAAPGGYAWPVRQTEKGLLLVAVVLFGLSLIARQWAYVRDRLR